MRKYFVESLELRLLMTESGFGEGGALTLSLPSDSAAVVARSDGRIVVAAHQSGVSAGAPALFVQQFLADGTPDPNFGGEAHGQASGTPAGQAWIAGARVPENVTDVRIAADGAIVILGTSTRSGKSSDLALVRLFADGMIDFTFGGPFHGSFDAAPGVATVDLFGGADTPLALALIPAGLIGVPVFTAQGSFAALLLPDGSRANEIADGGIVPFDQVGGAVFKDVVVMPTGSIYFCGVVGASAKIFRQGQDGQLDSHFGTDGILTVPIYGLPADATYDGPLHMEVLPDGRLMLLSRYADPSGSFEIAYAMRFSESGRPDDSFGDNGVLRIGADGDVNIVDLTLSGSDPIVLTTSTNAGTGSPPQLHKIDGVAGAKLSGKGTVVVNGTGEADVIALWERPRDSRVVFEINGVAQSFSTSKIRHIEINAFGGDDVVTIASDVRGAFIDGGAGDDSITGGDGDDIIVGNLGDDNLIGGTGNDHITGNHGSDYLRGGAGHDFLSGNAGRDTLRGAGGNDILYGGAGVLNRLHGGKGFDAAEVQSSDTFAEIERMIG